MRYFILTFGCQQNKADSERIAGDYVARGWSRARSWRTADHIIINSCAVRQSAEDRVRGLCLNIRRYFASRSVRPTIILTGCMTYHGESALRDLLPIDLILPLGQVGFDVPPLRQSSVHAWVVISEGCNSFCSYCVVPYARGREKSRSQAEILHEIRSLTRKGYREITLLGQNVNSWGLDRVGIGIRKYSFRSHAPRSVPPFVSLLRAVTRIKGIQIIRFLTSNPWDFSDALILELARNPKLDRFIHLPVQSGSNAVLTRMNRGYTRETYLDLVSRLRASVPDVRLGTDLIVGFPGETEADFQLTVDLARLVNWEIAFVARYSPRPGTVAATYPDDVSAREKKRRWQILEDLINKPHLGAKRPKVVK